MLSEIRGTIQNDVLKKFIVQNTYIYPNQQSLRRVAVDVMGYNSLNMPLLNSFTAGEEMGKARTFPSPPPYRIRFVHRLFCGNRGGGGNKGGGKKRENDNHDDEEDEEDKDEREYRSV